MSLPVVWDDTVTHHYTPRLFTREAWESLSPTQRDLIRRQRQSVVSQLQIWHEARYHRGEHLHDLALALVKP